MNMIVLMTAASAPLAMLGLSTPDGPQRSCVFMLHPQITPAVFESNEGKIVFPDRATEYPCSYSKRRGGTTISFTNQNGWRFSVRIAAGRRRHVVGQPRSGHGVGPRVIAVRRLSDGARAEIQTAG